MRLKFLALAATAILLAGMTTGKARAAYCPYENALTCQFVYWLLPNGTVLPDMYCAPNPVFDPDLCSIYDNEPLLSVVPTAPKHDEHALVA